MPYRETDVSGNPGPAMIVLLTDGESNRGRPPTDAAAAAKEENIPIYTIGIGKRGRVTYLNNGQAVGLDESTLVDMAQVTGGQYFYAVEPGALEDIYFDISSLIGWVDEKMEITALDSAAGNLLILIGCFLSLRWFQQFP
jgi:Ca-activated chloride channel homolog